MYQNVKKHLRIKKLCPMPSIGKGHINFVFFCFLNSVTITIEPQSTFWDYLSSSSVLFIISTNSLSPTSS